MQVVRDVSEDPDQAANFLPKGNNLKMPGGIRELTTQLALVSLSLSPLHRITSIQAPNKIG
jgi:hypothetical protein